MTGTDDTTICPRCGLPAERTARFCPHCGAAITVSAAEQDELIGKTLLDRYRVVRVVGQGGMGRVYLAEQRLGRATRRVAVKCLTASAAGSAAVIERFHREAATILALTHPCTVRLYDFGEQNGQLYLVMEYAEGERLAEVLARGPLPLARAIPIVVQIAGSLDEAHQHGIVHRDLKPENVILAKPTGGSPFVKVVDFGVSKNVDHARNNPAITSHGMLVGTPAYMAPEQFTDLPVDGRTDVYALGLLTYQMLAGVLPWSARTVYEWANLHVNEPVPPLEARAPGLPPRVYSAVHRALAKLPSDRPGNALAFARELSGVGDGGDPWTVIVSEEMRDESVRPRPAARTPDVSLETLQRATPRAMLRRQWAGVFVAVFAVAIALGFGVVSWVVRHRRAGSHPVTVTARDAGATVLDDGGSRVVGDLNPDPGAVHPNWPRAQSVLVEGATRVESGDLDAAIRALETAQDLIGPTSVKLLDLRESTSRLGASHLREDLAAHRCREAQALVRRLRRVGAELGTYELFGHGCAAP